MALITITGYPCSGKTTRANEIKSYIESRISNSSQSPKSSSNLNEVIILNDNTLGISRDSYDDSQKEKVARGILFGALQKNISGGGWKVILLDGMNYIKGWRYQCFCVAKEAGVRVATVYVAATEEVCRERWNKMSEDGGEKENYKEETFTNLIQRYEEPTSMARWDKPLFTIPWDQSLALSPSPNDTPEDAEGGGVLEEIYQAISTGILLKPNAGTVAPPKTPTTALETLDKITTSIINSILSSQSFGGNTIKITLPSTSETISFTLTVALTHPHLLRLKRQFISSHKKAITLGSTEKGGLGFEEGEVAKRFVEFIEGT